MLPGSEPRNSAAPQQANTADGTPPAALCLGLGRQPRLTFQRVPEPKTGKTRIHLDIQVDDIDGGRQHVESLGGQWSGVRHDYDEGVVLVMHDPEGHKFCIVEYYVS